MYYHVFGTFRYFTTGVVTQYWRTVNPIVFDDAPKLVASWGNQFSSPENYYSSQEGRLRYWYIASKYGQIVDLIGITPTQNGSNYTGPTPGNPFLFSGFERISKYNNPPTLFPFFGGYEVEIDRVVEVPVADQPPSIPQYSDGNYIRQLPYLRVFPLMPAMSFATEVSFNTVILENNIGTEQRIINWYDPIRTFNLSRELLTEQQLNNLLDFHEEVKGTNEAFLYKDLSDFKATAILKELANDTTTQGVLYPNPDGTNRAFQLVKQYKCADNVHNRIIVATVPNTLQVFEADGVAAINSDLYYLLPDRILFKVAPTASNEYLKAEFQFYTPVRFESDQLDYTPINKTDKNGVKRIKYRVPQLILKETRLEPYRAIEDTVTPNLDHTFPIDMFAGCTISPKFENKIISLSSGWDKRSLKRRRAQNLNRLQEKNIINADKMEYLLTLWLNTKGGAVTFRFDDLIDDNPYTVRFNNPSLNYENKSLNLIFGLKELQIKKFTDVIIPDIGTGETLTEQVLSLCHCVQITLTTGEKLGFTTFSRDIQIDGVTFKSSRSFDPTALERKLDLSVDNQELKSAIDDVMTESYLTASKLRNAEIITALIDINNLPNTLLDLHESQIQIGVVGEVTSTSESYTLENLTKTSTLLRQSKLLKTEPICHKDFGSDECGIDLDNSTHNGAPFKVTTCVTTVIDRKKFYVNAIVPNSAYGKIIFKDGLNAGGIYPIYSCLTEPVNGRTLLELFVGCPDTISPNDEVEITAGCSKLQSDCRKYNNFDNYGGIPSGGNWMPGNDFYLRSPKSP